MLGLTALGIVHTLVSLVALAAGLIALLRGGAITLDGALGKVYWLTTFVTAATGLGIFQHGGFGKPHILSILTIATLLLALTAGRTALFGRFSRHVEVVGYSATFLFHLIPGITETTTRLPFGAPLFANADAPALQTIAGVLAVLFLIGAGLQLSRLRVAST